MFAGFFCRCGIAAGLLWIRLLFRSVDRSHSMIPTLADVRRTQPPTDIELAAIVRNFHTARVLVVGDVILDRYISGAVNRLSPEAPIPVLRPANNHCTL